MSSLFKIGQATQAALEYVEAMGGEITPELEQAELELAQKVDRCVLMTKAFPSIKAQLKDQLEAIKCEIERVEKAEERFTQRMIDVMLGLEKTELVGEDSVMRISPTKGSVEITNEDEAKAAIGEEVITTTIKVSKDKIRKLIEEGKILPYAKLKQNWSLKTKLRSKV